MDRKVLKCHIRYSSSEICTTNTTNSQKHDTISKEDSVIYFLYNYLDIDFEVVYAPTNNRHADKNSIRLVDLGSVFLFFNYKLSTSSGQPLEEISAAQINV